MEEEADHKHVEEEDEPDCLLDGDVEENGEPDQDEQSTQIEDHAFIDSITEMFPRVSMGGRVLKQTKHFM